MLIKSLIYTLKLGYEVILRLCELFTIFFCVFMLLFLYARCMRLHDVISNKQSDLLYISDIDTFKKYVSYEFTAHATIAVCLAYNVYRLNKLIDQF